MYLLFAVINNEDLLDELITGWMDLGISGATVIETTGALQLVSQHVPIFAGLRSLTSGGTAHSKTVFTAIETGQLLNEAIAFLENLTVSRYPQQQGVYFATPITHFGRFGKNRKND